MECINSTLRILSFILRTGLILLGPLHTTRIFGGCNSEKEFIAKWCPNQLELCLLAPLAFTYIYTALFFVVIWSVQEFHGWKVHPGYRVGPNSS